MNRNIFITGGTGYIGSAIIPELLKRKFQVNALVRKGSESKLNAGCNAVAGNALDRFTYENKIIDCDTFIHLIGVHHPGPGKKDEFKNIDLISIEQAATAAVNAGVKHFIYLSVAHPAPVMKEFIKVRMQGEEILSQSGMRSSFIRPWYVLGPGHYWPYMLLPVYKLFELFPFSKDTAFRLHPVKLNQIINCLVYAVQTLPESVAVYETKEIVSFDRLKVES
ncbi:MAG TPA: NAD(P)H-binding protein [Ignavibacteria bacterium]|nr:NAD(P)H-binding protein [Ignavibacteria bacterium]